LQNQRTSVGLGVGYTVMDKIREAIFLNHKMVQKSSKRGNNKFGKGKHPFCPHVKLQLEVYSPQGQAFDKRVITGADLL